MRLFSERISEMRVSFSERVFSFRSLILASNEPGGMLARALDECREGLQLERYFTNGSHMEITDSMAEALMATVIKTARLLRENPGSYEARAEMMWFCGKGYGDTRGRSRTRGGLERN